MIRQSHSCCCHLFVKFDWTCLSSTRDFLSAITLCPRIKEVKGMKRASWEATIRDYAENERQSSWNVLSSDFSSWASLQLVLRESQTHKKREHKCRDVVLRTFFVERKASWIRRRIRRAGGEKSLKARPVSIMHLRGEHSGNCQVEKKVSETRDGIGRSKCFLTNCITFSFTSLCESGKTVEKTGSSIQWTLWLLSWTWRWMPTESGNRHVRRRFFFTLVSHVLSLFFASKNEKRGHELQQCPQFIFETVLSLSHVLLHSWEYTDYHGCLWSD